MAIAAATVIVVVIFHAPLLQALAGFLTATPTADRADYIAVIQWSNGPDGYRCYETAAELFLGKNGQKPAQGVLLVPYRPERLQEVGALPTFEELSRRELSAHGVPPQAISVVESRQCGNWSTSQAIRHWLDEHRNATTLVLCSEFSSAHLRSVLDHTIDADSAKRVHVYPLSDPYSNTCNWWKSRHGFRAFGFAWLIRIHGWFYGDAAAKSLRADADEYERRFWSKWK